MLRTFIFKEDKKNWLEEDQVLLLHDLCALLDEDEKIIYLWRGPKSSQERFQNGFELITELMGNYPDDTIQLILLEQEIPNKIKLRLDAMLETVKKYEKEKIQKLNRLFSIRLYFYSSLTAILLPAISLLIISCFFLWPLTEGNFEVSANIYELWLGIPRVLMFITLILHIIIIGVGIVELDYPIIVYSLIGIILSAGIFLYLNQGIFLFLFQKGHTSTLYLISLIDLLLFLIALLIAALTFLIPNVLKLVSFYKSYKEYIFLGIKKDLKKKDAELKEAEKLRKNEEKINQAREKTSKAIDKAKLARDKAKEAREMAKNEQKRQEEKEKTKKKEEKAKLKEGQKKIKEKEQALKKEERAKKREEKAKIKEEKKKAKENELARKKE